MTSVQPQSVEEGDDACKLLSVVTKYSRNPKPNNSNIYLSSFSPLQLCFLLSLLSGTNSWVTQGVISYRLGKSIGLCDGSNWPSLSPSVGVLAWVMCLPAEEGWVGKENGCQWQTLKSPFFPWHKLSPKYSDSSRQKQAEGASHLWVAEEGGVQMWKVAKWTKDPRAAVSWRFCGTSDFGSIFRRL